MKKNETKQAPQESWRMWTVTLLVLGLSILVISLLSRQNTSLNRVLTNLQKQAVFVQNEGKETKEVIDVCDVGALCIQESASEGGYFGVAQATAHLVGEVTYEEMGEPETCYMMQIDSINDVRAQEEINISGNGKGQFVVSQEDAERFAATTAENPASLTVYIAERVGRGTSACATRVHIVN